MSLAETMQQRTREALVQLAQEKGQKIQVLMQTIQPLMDEAAAKGVNCAEVLGELDQDLYDYLTNEQCTVSVFGTIAAPKYSINWDNPSSLPHTIPLVLASDIQDLQQRTQKARTLNSEADHKEELLLLVSILSLLADQGIAKVRLEFSKGQFSKDTLQKATDLCMVVRGPLGTPSKSEECAYEFEWY